MCSTYEDGVMPMKLDRSELVMKDCMKCKNQKAHVVIRVNDPFCRECFVQLCTHKFRSAFGKSKLVRDGEKVLVAFSGGHASSAMLHLIQEGKSSRAQKKLRFQPSFIFIDESSVLPSSGDAENSVGEVEVTLKSSDYDYHIVSLHEVMLSTDDSCPLTADKKLKELFASVKTITAKEQLLKTLRCNLLEIVARRHGYTKVIAGDTATRLSVTILSNIAQGKGAHIAYDTSLADDRFDDLLLIRPMRDFTSKEVALYNSFYNIQPVVLPAFSTKGSNSISIDRLTQAFVTGLQADFPSTVSTIMRTGDKLMNRPSLAKQDNDCTQVNTCILCKAPVDTEVSKSSALESIRYSDVLATERLNHTSRSPQATTNQSRDQFMQNSCYSCLQIIKDMDDSFEFPVEFLYHKQKREMKALVDEYLLT